MASDKQAKSSTGTIVVDHDKAFEEAERKVKRESVAAMCFAMQVGAINGGKERDFEKMTKRALIAADVFVRTAAAAAEDAASPSQEEVAS